MKSSPDLARLIDALVLSNEQLRASNETLLHAVLAKSAPEFAQVQRAAQASPRRLDQVDQRQALEDEARRRLAQMGDEYLHVQIPDYPELG